METKGGAPDICSETKKAADEIRAIARLRDQRLNSWGGLPRPALSESLGLGYKYVAPLGLEFEAKQPTGTPVLNDAPLNGESAQ